METDLILRMDSDLVESARRYAKQRGKSLSQITAEYYKALIALENGKSDAHTSSSPELPPLTRSLRGLLRESGISVQDYHQHLEEKYHGNL